MCFFYNTISLTSYFLLGLWLQNRTGLLRVKKCRKRAFFPTNPSVLFPFRLTLYAKYRILQRTKAMKKLFAIALVVTTILPISCGHKTATTADDADSTLTADETVKQGIIQMEKSEVTDTTTWRGAIYTYTVNRMPDPHLDKITDSETGSKYMDNTIRLTIVRDGQTFFDKQFTKSDFTSYLDHNFRRNGLLEGMVFDSAQPEGLHFATSMALPQSDSYIPLVVIIASDGTLSIQKDNIMDVDGEDSMD